MYRGFNLTFNSFDNSYFKIGNKLYEQFSLESHNVLDKYVSIDGSLNGSLMQRQWFPNIKADIFISHSHKNKEKAISLAGLLYEEMKLVSFIDSCVWGYSNKLLKLIDNEYCLNYNGNYSYDKRNDTTSHVHIMLNTALSMMIDNTECLFFLNTPESLIAEEVVSKTKSPWLYSEISTSKLIRKKTPKSHRDILEKGFTKYGLLDEGVDISHEIDLSELEQLNGDDIINWLNRWKNTSKMDVNPLDLLYKLKPLN